MPEVLRGLIARKEDVTEYLSPVPLLVMSDFAADPVWLRAPDGGAARMVRLERLPLSESLCANLRAWAKEHDAWSVADYVGVTPERRDAWIRRGEALTREVREELGPEWDVQCRKY
jgi:hypothetical protein